MKVFGCISLFIVIWVLPKISYSQDKLLSKLNKDTISVKIYEIGTKEVLFKPLPLNDSLDYMVLELENLIWIKLENGIVMHFYEFGFKDPTLYVNQYKSAFKIQPLSSLFGNIFLNYEKSIKPSRSWEIGVGILGLSNKTMVKSGFLVRAGYKYIQTPNYKLKGIGHVHILKGAYLQPQIIATTYTTSEKVIKRLGYVNNPMFSYKYEKTLIDNLNIGMAAMLNVGKQWVFSNLFLIDLYVGMGVHGKFTSILHANTTLIINGNINEYYGYDIQPKYSGISYLTDFQDFGINFTAQVGIKLGLLLGFEIEKK